MKEKLKFSVVDIDHNHAMGMADMLMAAGGELASFHAADNAITAKFMEKFPSTPRVNDVGEIYADGSVPLVVVCGIPDLRGPRAIEAMRAGKHVLVDKPGVVNFDQLAQLRAVHAETGRMAAFYYSEHFGNRPTVKAMDLVRGGAIGEVMSFLSLGPHRLTKSMRPDWFFERARYGGILGDLTTHQIEQFLSFTGADDVMVQSANIANFGNPETPGLQDVGDIHLRTPTALGYVRVDFSSPEALGTWGDAKVVVTGTKGYIELRAHIDIAGRPGVGHLFLVNDHGPQYIDCNDVRLPYGAALLDDVANGTQTACPQWRYFKVAEIALRAQALAEASRAGQGHFRA
jgi:predicted dehydrogenase